MHTVFALLCFVVVVHWLIFPYPSGLLHWHCGNLTIAPVPAKQPWWIWINTSCEFIMNDCITTTKQSTTKPCAYFLGYTVRCHHLYFLLLLVLTGCDCVAAATDCGIHVVMALFLRSMCTLDICYLWLCLSVFFGNKYMHTQDIKGYSYDSRNIRTPRILHVAKIFFWDRLCCPKYTVWRMGNCICFVLRSMCSI